MCFGKAGLVSLQIQLEFNLHLIKLKNVKTFIANFSTETTGKQLIILL